MADRDTACTTAAARKGLGKHVEAVAAKDPQNLIDIAMLADVSEALAITACTLGKSAFAVTLLRIMVQRWIKWVIYFILLTMNLVSKFGHLSGVIQAIPGLLSKFSTTAPG